MIEHQWKRPKQFFTWNISLVILTSFVIWQKFIVVFWRTITWISGSRAVYRQYLTKEEWSCFRILLSKNQHALAERHSYQCYCIDTSMSTALLGINILIYVYRSGCTKSLFGNGEWVRASVRETFGPSLQPKQKLQVCLIERLVVKSVVTASSASKISWNEKD